MDKDVVKSDDFEGQCFIALDTLKDQQKVENWYNLEAEDGPNTPWQGRIRLQLWWIHSKVKLLEDRIKQTEDDILKINED